MFFPEILRLLMQFSNRAKPQFSDALNNLEGSANTAVFPIILKSHLSDTPPQLGSDCKLDSLILNHQLFNTTLHLQYLFIHWS